jgi:hypothetical protein
MNIINVIIQTIKSLATIKCGKTAAAAINALAYGLYTYIIVLTNCDLPMLAKCVIVALANFIGVYVVKLFEQKARKDKLWKVEATLKNEGLYPEHDDCVIALRQAGIPMNYIDINKYLIINCYCTTQTESAIAKKILDSFDAKYFVSESKVL